MNTRRLYESTFIVNAALDDIDIEAVIQKVASYVENNGGEVTVINRWGRRRLAYPINKKFNGFYARVEFQAPASTVPVLERFLVLEDTILRHLTLLVPDKLVAFRKSRIVDEASIHHQLFSDQTTKELTGEKSDAQKKKDEKEEIVIKKEATTLQKVAEAADNEAKEKAKAEEKEEEVSAEEQKQD